MLKDSTYKQKFQMLKFWMPSIIETVKKDIRNEHFKQNPAFFRKHFPGKPVNRVTAEELSRAYLEELSAGAEELGEWLASRWLLKNTELYGFFEEKLRAINPQFDQLEILTQEQAKEISSEAVNRFGSLKTYIFSVTNAVVFPEETFKQLDKQAAEETKQTEQTTQEEQRVSDIEGLRRRHQLELARLEDKYEKKLGGLQKKYLTDVESLKKQLSTAQRKLHELTSARG